MLARAVCRRDLHANAHPNAHAEPDARVVACATVLPLLNCTKEAAVEAFGDVAYEVRRTSETQIMRLVWASEVCGGATAPAAFEGERQTL